MTIAATERLLAELVGHATDIALTLPTHARPNLAGGEVAMVQFGRYNDGIIQASLLRAARPTELDFAGDAGLSKDAARIIRRIVADSNRARGEAASEFLVAIGSGRLKLDRNGLETVPATLDGAPPLVEELRQLAVKATVSAP